MADIPSIAESANARGLPVQVRLISWLQRQRSSTRLAFILQIVCRVGFSVLSFLWTPLLLGSMGKALYGLFLSFQSVASLGGLGDLGVGGAVNIQTSRLLGQGKVEELRSFLASTRGLFAAMAATVTFALLTLAPWLHTWLDFEALPGAGSLTALFALGAVGAGLLVLSSYITNLSYGLSNLTWPVVPTFLLAQLSILGHWLLARQHLPLWMQYLPYVVTALAGLALYWFFIHQSHPQQAGLFPIVFAWKRFLSLAESSFWVYLYCLASGIYVTIDRLLINAGFGAEQIPTYQLNFRLCELALFIICSASLASLPKITQWLASPAAADQERAVRETDRLNKFQTLLGCGAVLVYLAVNDAVMKVWLGVDYQAPLLWQAAFAANMAVSAAGYAGFSLAGRCDERGIRVGGIVAGVTALLKLVLSYAAMKMGSILGIALATVISQSFVVLTLCWYTARHLKISFWDFAIKGWLISLAMVIVSLALRMVLPLDSATNLFLIGAASGVALLTAAWVMKVKLADVRYEIAVVRSILGK